MGSSPRLLSAPVETPSQKWASVRSSIAQIPHEPTATRVPLSTRPLDADRRPT